MIRTCLSILVATIALIEVPITAEAQVSVRPDLMYCGTSSRTGANLYLGAGTFNEVQGCTPDADTQAMLVERGGSVGGNGAAWLAYLNAGGIIITEFNHTHNVYNEIYGTAYLRGENYGNCYDNAMPSRIIDPGHPFWVDNPIPPTPEQYSSCGYSINGIVAGEPEVQVLGGEAGSDVMSFACREQSAGTLYLLDHDWQDSNANYSDDSRYFMGELITRSSCGRGSPMVFEPVPSVTMLGMLLMILGVGWYGLRRIRINRQ